MHLNIAHALEQVYSSTLEEHAEDLAHHYWSAGGAADPIKALGYLQVAGEKSVQSSANIQAISHFRKALGLIQHLPVGDQRRRSELALHLDLGGALIATKGYSTREVIGVYARARELSQQAGEARQLFRILWGQWVNCASRAEYITSLEFGQECLNLAQSAADTVLLCPAPP
jgi:predicted ATPase